MKQSAIILFMVVLCPLSPIFSQDIDITWVTPGSPVLTVPEGKMYAVAAAGSAEQLKNLATSFPAKVRFPKGIKVRQPVSLLLESALFFRIDTSKPDALTARYSIEGKTETLFLSPRGSVISRIEGLPSSETITVFLSELASLETKTAQANADLGDLLKKTGKAFSKCRMIKAQSELKSLMSSAGKLDYDGIVSCRIACTRLIRESVITEAGNAKILLLSGKKDKALLHIEGIEKNFADIPEAAEEIEKALQEIKNDKTELILTDWWQGGSLGAVYYTGKGAQKLAAFENLGKQVSQALNLPYREIHASDVLGGPDDENGILLYPDGTTRVRLFIMPGGQAHDTFLELGGKNGVNECRGRTHIQKAFRSGMNYVGSCGGCWFACSGWDVKNAFVHSACLWPGKLNAVGPARQDPPPDILIDRFHPLGKAAPGGILKGVFFNGGPTQMTRDVPGTEYIGFFQGGGLSSLWGKSALIAYNSPDYSGGRLVVTAAHPETKFPVFLRAMGDYACQHPYAMPRNPVEAGKQVQGLSGDRQFQYYEINVPEQAFALSVSLSGMNGNCDLMVNHGFIPGPGRSKSASAKPGEADESVTVKKPEQGTWFIGVYGNHDILNSVTYSLTVTVE